MSSVIPVARIVQTPASPTIVREVLGDRRLRQSFWHPTFGRSANKTLARLSKINPHNFQQMLLILDQVKLYLDKLYKSTDSAILELPSADVLATLPLEAMLNSNATMKDLVSRKWIRRDGGSIIVNFAQLEAVCQDKTLPDHSVANYFGQDS